MWWSTSFIRCQSGAGRASSMAMSVIFRRNLSLFRRNSSGWPAEFRRKAGAEPSACSTATGFHLLIFEYRICRFPRNQILNGARSCGYSCEVRCHRHLKTDLKKGDFFARERLCGLAREDFCSLDTPPYGVAGQPMRIPLPLDCSPQAGVQPRGHPDPR